MARHRGGGCTTSTHRPLPGYVVYYREGVVWCVAGTLHWAVGVPTQGRSVSCQFPPAFPPAVSRSTVLLAYSLYAWALLR